MRERMTVDLTDYPDAVVLYLGIKATKFRGSSGAIPTVWTATVTPVGIGTGGADSPTIHTPRHRAGDSIPAILKSKGTQPC